MRCFLLLAAALLIGVDAYVYTCNEASTLLIRDVEVIYAARACVVIPAGSADTKPYSDYLSSAFLVQEGGSVLHYLADIVQSETYCVDGGGPWALSAERDTFSCTTEQGAPAEILFVYTSDDTTIVRAETTPTTATYKNGTYTFVAPEGSLLIEKKSIKDGKEATLHFFNGAGANAGQEKFAMMQEKFVAGTSTVIIGPVTTMEIEEDVEMELTISSFAESKILTAPPGFEYSLMASGRANDLQSTRPSILLSTIYKNDADAISITGTALMDDSLGTEVLIQCFNAPDGSMDDVKVTKTSDIIINNDNCQSLDITYHGHLDPLKVDRSTETIYLRVSSRSKVPQPSVDPPTDAPPATLSSDLPDAPSDAPVTVAPPGAPTSRRTMRPTTSATSRKAEEASSTTAAASPTTQSAAVPTTSAAAAASWLAAAVAATLFACT